MDFGSFLRQRQQRNVGGSNSNDFGPPQTSWNQPFVVGNQAPGPGGFGMNPNANDWDARDPYFDNGNPDHWEMGNDAHEQQDPSFSNFPNSMNPDQQGGPWIPSRGRGGNCARGRGRGHPDGPGGRGRYPMEEGDWHGENGRGFGRGSARGRMHNNAPPDNESESVFFSWPEDDGNKDGYGHNMAQNSSGFEKEGPGESNSEYWADGDLDSSNQFQNQKVEKDESLTLDQPQKKPFERIDRWKELPDSDRSEDDKKILSDFDIMQVTVNWAHFGVSKSMLREASEVGRNGISKKKNFDTSKLEFYCKLCDVQTVSAGNFYDHLCGKKHLAKVEFEITPSKPTDTESTPLDEQECKTYGGLMGMENVVKTMADNSNDSHEANAKDIKFEMDNSYEKNFFYEFDITQYKIDWQEQDITERMLKEASTDTKEVKYEDKCCDVFNLHFYCRLCDVQSTSLQTFKVHLVGKKHMNKSAKYLPLDESQCQEEGEREEPPTGGAIVEANKNLDDDYQKMKYFDIRSVDVVWDNFGITKEMLNEAAILGIPGVSHKKKAPEFDVTKLEVYCKLCAVQMSSPTNFHDHLIGKKHKAAYQEHVKFTSAEEYRQTTDMLDAKDLGKKSIFDVVDCEDKPIVGLSYIVELHSVYQLWNVCRLCGCKFQAISSITHVTGQRHRTMYVRKEHPDAYKVLTQKFENQQPFSHILNQMIAQKEKSDGCGTSQIKRYDPSKEGDPSPVTTGNCNDNERVVEHNKKLRKFFDWVKTEFDEVMTEFSSQFDYRPPSPLLKEKFKYESNPQGPEMSSRRPGWPLLSDPRHDLLPHPVHNFPPHREDYPRHPRDRFPPYDFPPDLPPHLRHNYPPRHDHLPPQSSRSPPPHFSRRPNRHEDAPIPPRPYRDMPLERDPYFDIQSDPRRPPSYLDSDRQYRSRHLEKPDDYIDPDPLKRVLKSKTIVTPDPHKRLHSSEPYIDPDPLKRILPSQKAKLKPVVIDYSHGNQEKSDKTKAEEWENDLNDILGSSKSKEPDSLSLLSCSYSSPPREKLPPETKLPSKQLPFSKSYLERERATLKLRSPERKLEKRSFQSSSHYKKNSRSRSPDNLKYRRLSSHSKRSSRSSRSPPYRSPSPRRSPSPQTYKFSKKSKKSRKRSLSPLSPPIRFNRSRSRSPYGRRRRSKSPTNSFSKSRSHVAPLPRNVSPPGPPRSKSPLRPATRAIRLPDSPTIIDISPPRPESPLGPTATRNIGYPSLPRSRSPPYPPTRRNISPLPSRIPTGHHRSKSPPARNMSPPAPPDRNRSSPAPPDRNRSPPAPLARNKSPPGLTISKKPVSYKRPESSGYSAMSQTFEMSSGSPAKLPKTVEPVERETNESSLKRPPMSQAVDEDDAQSDMIANMLLNMKPPTSPAVDEDDAQADMIANMLLNMKHSIVGSEIDDPHAALQALLSSKGLAEALLASKSEPSPSRELEGHGVETSGHPSMRKASPPTSKREKIAFSFQGKSFLPSKNIPPTFVEEDSEDDEN